MITFVLPGAPMAKPRMTRKDQFLGARSFRPRDEREMKRQQLLWTYFSWCDALRAASGSHEKRQLLTPAVLTVRAYFAMPKGWSNRRFLDSKGGPHTVKPDADNILKAVCDALVTNDQMVWDKRVQKFWADLNGPRIEIELTCPPSPTVQTPAHHQGGSC